MNLLVEIDTSAAARHRGPTVGSSHAVHRELAPVQRTTISGERALLSPLRKDDSGVGRNGSVRAMAETLMKGVVALMRQSLVEAMFVPEI